MVGKVQWLVLPYLVPVPPIKCTPHHPRHDLIPPPQKVAQGDDMTSPINKGGGKILSPDPNRGRYRTN